MYTHVHIGHLRHRQRQPHPAGQELRHARVQPAQEQQHNTIE